MGVTLDLNHWKNRLHWILTNPVGWVAMAVIVSVIGFIMLLQSRTERVTVTATAWEFTYRIEKYKIRPFEGFEPPSDAFEVRSLGQRIHHWEQVFDGYTTESYSCGQTCFGQGTSQSCTTQTCTRMVPQYHDEPVYRPYYAWRAWRWGYDRKAVFAEKDRPIRRIDESEFRFKVGLKPGEDERYARTDEFDVVMANDDDSWEYEPDGLAEFVRYAMNQRLTIRVNSFGSILDSGFGE